jgi:hypothetical protein
MCVRWHFDGCRHDGPVFYVYLADQHLNHVYHVFLPALAVFSSGIVWMTRQSIPEGLTGLDCTILRTVR